MEYGEFNSINTSLVEYERTTKRVPTMKPLDGAKKETAVKEPVSTAPEKIDFSKVEIEPLFSVTVDFDTFSKSDFRAVKVLECEAVPKSKKLLKFTLDDGTGTERTILSGIHAFYEPDELVGKTLIAITNLPPRAMMGIDSCGMLLSAIHNEDGEAMAPQTLPLDAPAFIEDGRTYLPVRFVAENLGATVTWNGDTQTVTITRADK